MKLNHNSYFENERNNKNPIFLDRFPGIDFKDLNVLDLGCGQGAMVIDLAMKGAAQVVGVDINTAKIEFAKKKLETNFPELRKKITFRDTDFRMLCNDQFDIIISKASFEHIIDLDGLFNDIKNKLKIGGKLITGFGPLYNSPWGDHNRLNHKLPWGHLIFPTEHLIERLNRQRETKAKSIFDLGLNGYPLKKYKNLFYNTDGFKVIDFKTNVSNKVSMKLFKLASCIPMLQEYFTYNIYCILERFK
jgi:2-polyprenyl-3-methyl-5-hydroxy-6-metoxy-1,4-benzoquinol methylase